MDDQTKSLIQNHIDTNDVCLFMKGTPDQPQCGFSMTVSNILKMLEINFKGVNVLEDQSLRDGIKVFSDWPTIPQLYIKKEFIGGIISPGVETSVDNLISKAALLNQIDFKFPESVIGKNTKTNIQSGIMFGAVSQVEGLINRIELESNQKYNIILTGGFSKLLSNFFGLGKPNV